MKKTLWTSEEIKQATQGQITKPFQATGVSIDTRTLEAGDLFIALQGEHVDGHDFLEKAIVAGASAALVSKAPQEECDIPLVIVKDVVKALNAMAEHRRKHSKAKIIGITGSVGKTSTKMMLATVLGKQAKTFASEGNLNNHLGVPLSLARMPLDTEYGVFELGMNHAGEIRGLSKLLRPHIAVITAISAVHLEFFDSLQAIAEAKAEIFEGLVQGASAVVPYDTDFLPLLAGRCSAPIDHIKSFGVGEHAAYKLLKGKEKLRMQEISVNADGIKLEYRLGLVGRHHALNSLAVLAAVSLAGADVKRASEDFANIRPTEGRGRLYASAALGKPYLLMDDSYNASPASVRAALTVLRLAEKRKIAVLGDMLELGKDEVVFHQQLAKDIVNAGVSKVFTAGNQMKHLYDALPEALRGIHCAQALDLLPAVSEAVQEGDTVLVKGSHGSKMYQVAESLRKAR